jgi:hypothetical protein
VIDRFTYSVVDDRGGVSASNTALVVVVATPVPDPDPTNAPPTANDDTATTSRGVPVTIDVLANDSDPDADDLAVSGTTTPGHGTVRVSAGAVTYTPDDGFTGQDTFTYAISDGRGGTDLATVSVTVTPPPNRPPDAVDDEATTGRDLPVTVDVLGNDTDADQDELTVTGAGTPGNGTAVVNADGTITYTPDDGFTGQDTLTYTVSDGRGGTATATVRVIVQQDLTVQVLAVDRVDLGEGDVWFVTVAVDGLESGGATLRATSDPPGARVIGNDCQALLTTGCRVTPGRHEFEIQLQAPVGTTLTFEVDPDDQTEDFDAGNNMGSETLVEPVE